MKDIITKINESSKGYTNHSLEEIWNAYFNKPNVSDGEENMLYDLIMFIASKKPQGAGKEIINQAIEIANKMNW